MADLIVLALIVTALVWWLGVDLVVTAANVEKVVDGANVLTAAAGETITAGQCVFKDTATGSSTFGKLLKTDVDDGSRQFCDGIALNGGAANQPIQYQTAGSLDVGATLTVGVIYCASNTQGGIMPSADLSTGERVVILGVATAADNLKLIPGIFKPGATIP